MIQVSNTSYICSRLLYSFLRILLEPSRNLSPPEIRCVTGTVILIQRKLYGRDFQQIRKNVTNNYKVRKKKCVKNIWYEALLPKRKSVWKLSNIIVGRESPCNLLKLRSCPSYTIQAVCTSRHILRKFKNIKRKHHFYGKRPFLISLITF